MAYVNLQANSKTVSGVKKLLAKLVSRSFFFVALARLLILTRYKTCKTLLIISNKMQLFHSTIFLDYAI